MSCGAIGSGSEFLQSAIGYLECTGRTLGSSGYQSLAAAPFLGSLLLALLTVFIAIIGLRLMFGRHFDFGDAALAAAKVGFVLMLASSWPAVQTVIYGTVVLGPQQVVQRLGGEQESLSARLQNVDNGMVALTSWGTGKLDIRVGRTAAGEPAASAFTGEVTNESLGFSVGRFLFLLSAVVSLGGILLASGLLIALLPLFAGFLLFEQTRSLFLGWTKAMAFLFFSAVAVAALLTVQANVTQTWLQRLIGERQQFLATPGAPIEMMALSAIFLLLLLFSLWLIGRVCFNGDVLVKVRQSAAAVIGRAPNSALTASVSTTTRTDRFQEISRASHLASVLETVSRRESKSSMTSTIALQSSQVPKGSAAQQRDSTSSSRRAQPREAGSRARRDGR